MLTAQQRALLTKEEAALIDQTVPARLRRLSLEDVGVLYDRVRKGRDKYRTLHRRQAADQVARDGSRGKAATKNQGTAAKYEIFEDALSRVSRREAELARASSEALKQERLAAARAAKTGQKPSGSPAGPTQSQGRGPTSKGKGPTTKAQAAKTRSTQARSQAKRDAR